MAAGQGTPTEADDRDESERAALWDVAVDKLLQTSALLVLTKLIGSWLVVTWFGVELRSLWIWGIVPYVGLETTVATFRTVTAWSTALTAAVAVLWALNNLRRRNRLADPRAAWVGALAVPMAGLLAIFEWSRRLSADHLLPTGWLMWTLLCLGASSVVLAGFFDLPWETSTDESHEPPQRPNALPATRTPQSRPLVAPRSFQ